MMFPHMTPYTEPSYLFLLAVALILIVLSLLIWKKRLPTYQPVVTLFFLFVSFGGTYWEQGAALIGHAFWQTIPVWGYFVHRQRKNRTGWFYAAVILAIIPLFLTKVTPSFEHGKASLLGFLGISYLTFRFVQMIMEVRDDMIKVYDPFRYIRFLLFFPTISPGSIDRYRRFEKDQFHPSVRNKYTDLLGKGVQNILVGSLYKFIIGHYFGQVLPPIVGRIALQHGGVSWALVGYMYVYSMYLFFDFAGYSLFAVGTSYMMGYQTPINFSKPFLPRNIREFWNRWHMTLSFWFHDYVYIRLVFFIMKKKIFKSKIVMSNIGYFALFLLMGVWHGLMWYYIVYGLYHACLICLTDAWIRFKKKHKDQSLSNKFTHDVAIFLTFQAVCFSFLIFSGFLDKLFFSQRIATYQFI